MTPTLNKAKNLQWSQEPKRKGNKFYQTQEWKFLQKKVLRDYGCTCYYCGSKATHTDHFKPRYLFPELQLEYNNMRPMCKTGHDKKTYLEANIKTQEAWRKKIVPLMVNFKCN